MSDSIETRGPAQGTRINAGEITILIATRARPEMLAEVFGSLKANTVRKDKTSLWLYVDQDDQVTRRAIEEKRFPDLGFPVHWHIGPQTAGLGDTHEILWEASGRSSEAYVLFVDDARFDTAGWDQLTREAFALYPDGIFLAFPHDPMTADIATYPMFGWRWLDTLGRFFPGYFPFWYDDKWVDQVGRMVGRYVNIPISLSPIRGKGRTQRMRCLPFWTRFFQLALPERQETAIKLINAMYPKDESARAAALAKMQEVAAGFKKEEASFSDVYSTFQEERHTAMSPEERDRFSPLYFKQEANAVSRLLSIAQELFDQKQYAEALRYLEATQLADIRARPAQEMMVQCLRALGREKEAERVAKDAILAWPRMSTLRRFFRVVGMVANEAKGLLVRLTFKGKPDPNTKLS